MSLDSNKPRTGACKKPRTGLLGRFLHRHGSTARAVYYFNLLSPTISPYGTSLDNQKYLLGVVEIDSVGFEVKERGDVSGHRVKHACTIQAFTDGLNASTIGNNNVQVAARQGTHGRCK